jgi:transposase
VHDFVPAGHLWRFVVALVTEELDLSAILASYQGEKGQPPYHPAMMVALLLYAYAVGIYSSRRIATCAERVDFMAIVRTISEFRRRHLAALSALFVQVLKLCEAAGLVKLGHVALDGTKIKANTSKHKAMSYARMSKREAETQAEVDGWLKVAEAADAAEDKRRSGRIGAATRCRTGSPTSRCVPRESARPRLNWRRRRKPRPSRPRVRTITRSHPANRRQRRRQNRKRSATSPIRKAASARLRTATFRA